MNMHSAMMAVLAGWLVLAGAAMADDDGNAGHRGADVAPVTDPRYAQECGSCHFAYQPGLLPARSWRKLMGSLSDHFGDNAELATEDVAAITDYLVKNAADRSNYRRSAKIANSMPDKAVPLRISQVPYIAGKHDEIPARYVAGNPKVKSLSNCAACHTRAQQGSYSEHEIDIPGVGSWEDD